MYVDNAGYCTYNNIRTYVRADVTILRTYVYVYIMYILTYMHACPVNSKYKYISMHIYLYRVFIRYMP